MTLEEALQKAPHPNDPELVRHQLQTSALALSPAEREALIAELDAKIAELDATPPAHQP